MKNMSIEDAQSFVVKGHPREKGVWPQYYGLNTRLRGRLYFSDIIRKSDGWTNYTGEVAGPVDLSEQTPENYHDTHNHYQLILSEVWNFVPHVNAIPIWGDGTALGPNSNAWGAFFSARSAHVDTSEPGNAHLKESFPENFNPGPREDFDSQLCGLEVDVLNGGKPGVFPNKAKHGIQIVGFGVPNSHAISIICENFDCAPVLRKGQFEAAIYIQNSIHPDYGRVLVSDFDQAHIGLDFRKTIFSWGAVQLNAPKPGSGVVFSEGSGGEIYSGDRWSGSETTKNWMTIRVGEGGLRIVNHDGTKEIVAVDQQGGIHLNGDVYVNGVRLSTVGHAPGGNVSSKGVLALARAFARVGRLLESLLHHVRFGGESDEKA